MRNIVLSKPEAPVTWIDITGPSEQELTELASEFSLHPVSVQQSLDPVHLPKFETVEDTIFVILRGYDHDSGKEADDLHEMTRKVAIFFRDDLLITVHRKDQPYLNAMTNRWKNRHRIKSVTAIHILVDLVREIALSYRKPLEEAERAMETYESAIFDNTNLKKVLPEIYVVKRRLTVIKRMLWHTLNVVQSLFPPSEFKKPIFHEVREVIEHLYHHADELLEEMGQLLNMQLAIASHRTNEVVRILTVFSVFFMPLTFIVGIYGMNFRYMPELDSKLGYPSVWAMMLLISLAIFVWFRKKGWLR